MELRNLPRFRILEYLVEAGGRPASDLAVSGMGWSAWLEEMEPAAVGSLTVPRDMLILEGDDEPVTALHKVMRLKTMRGGG